ncbi:hypothetical protein, partial [Rhodopirellula sallentina]
MSLLVSLDCDFEDYDRLSKQFVSAESWNCLNDAQKQLYLTIRHEQDHHRLLNSTVVGSFLWLLDQIVYRDIVYLTGRVHQVDIYSPPFHLVLADDTKREFVISELGPTIGKVLDDTFEQLERLLVIREVLVGRRSYLTYRELLCGDFAEQFNAALAYMALRLGVEDPPQFRCRNPRELVFAEGERYNVRDMVECHAINMEIGAAQHHNDQGQIRRLLERTEAGSHANLFSTLQSSFPFDNLCGHST